jgi:putative salt-induced outer membrane protein YdiY
MPLITLPPRLHVAGALLIAAPALFFTSASAEEIKLTGGDRLTGTIIKRTDEIIILDHDALGRLEIALERVISIGEGESASGDTLASPAMLSDEGEAEADEKEWQSSFKLGLSSSFGNTDTQNLNAGVKSFRESDRDKTTLDAHYYYGASNGDRDTNKFTAGVLQDWFVPDSKWLYFAQGRYDFDEFQSWEHRLGAHGGVGYRLIEEDDLTLTLRGGAGVVREFGSDNEDVQVEGLIGADLGWQISERQTFTAATTIYPSISEGGEFRTVSSAEWSAMVDEESNMSVFARLEHEYQSQVDPGIDENDFRIIAGLQFDF